MPICAVIKGLGRSFVLDLTTAPEFFNLFSYIRKRQNLGLEWALEQIMAYPYKLDLDLGRQTLGDRHFSAAVTDSKDLRDHYFPLMGEDWYKVMIATCAIPRLYNDEIFIGDSAYVDGGVSASIPVQEAWRRQARSIVVIRTEPVLEEGAELSNEIQRKHALVKAPKPIRQKSWNGSVSRLIVCKTIGNKSRTMENRLDVILSAANSSFKEQSAIEDTLIYSMVDDGYLVLMIFIV